MTRYCGTIGIRQDPVEVSPGIFSENILELSDVRGDLIRETLRWGGGENNQQTVRATHMLSIVASEEIFEKLTEAVYVVFGGKKWSVVSIERQRPRVKLTLGGEYHV